MPTPPRYANRPFPPYRFIPGRGAPHPTRDPRGHSSGAPAATGEPMEPARWTQSEPYLFAIDLFNHRYWWEAHEELEPLWRAAGRTTQDGLFLQGLIQICAALLQHRMGAKATARLKAAAGCAKMRVAPSLHLGIDVARFTRDVARFLADERRSPPLVRLRMPACEPAGPEAAT